MFRKTLPLWVSAVLVVLIIVPLFDQTYFTKHPNVFQVYTGFSGTLIGGIIGFVGSLYGASKGSSISYNLSRKLAENQASKSLFTLLHYTYRMGRALNPVPDTPTLMEIIVYDQSWPQHVANVGNLTAEEIETIVGWFHILKTIEAISNHNSGFISSTAAAGMMKNSLPRIKLILQQRGYID